MTWKCHVHNEHLERARTIRLWQDKPGGLTLYARPIDFQTLQVEDSTPEDSFLSRGQPQDIDDMLRAIMTAAWECGIRPVGFESHANELAATRRHLEDMRLLAFEKGPEPVLEFKRARVEDIQR
jgi:hypothetical protein